MCYQLLCTNLGDGILHTLLSNHNIHRVYQRWTMYALKRKCVLEMHFRANSKKTQSLGKTAVDKSARIKACIYFVSGGFWSLLVLVSSIYE